MTSFTTPNPYVMALRQAEQARQIPELQSQLAMQPLEGQMVSGHYVAPSWTQGLGKLAHAWAARRGMDRANEMETKAGTGQMQRLAQALRGPSAEGVPDMLRRPDTQPMSERYANAGLPDLALQAMASERERSEKMADAKELLDYKRTMGADKPSSVAEWEYYSALSPEQQDAYLLMKRSNPYLNLGGAMVQPSPTQPGVAQGGFDITLKPGEEPGVRRAQARESAIGSAEGERAAGQRAAGSRVAQKTDQVALVNDLIDQSIGAANEWTTGFIGSKASQIEGTPAYDLARNLDTIKSNIGFDKLQELRDNSPTGGALGQVSEMENRLLQSTWGSVEQAQSKEQFVQNMQRMKEQVAKSWQRVADAYEQDYGVPYPGVEGGMSSNDAAPEGVDPEDWKFMTPEERALFQ